MAEQGPALQHELLWIVHDYLLKKGLQRAADWLLLEGKLQWSADIFEGLVKEGNWEEALERWELLCSGLKEPHKPSQVIRFNIQRHNSLDCCPLWRAFGLINPHAWISTTKQTKNYPAARRTLKSMEWVKSAQPDVFSKLKDLLFEADITKMGLSWAPGEASRLKLLEDNAKNIKKTVEVAIIALPPPPPNRLQVLIKQAVDRQAQQCKRKYPNSHTNTAAVSLYKDHACGPSTASPVSPTSSTVSVGGASGGVLSRSTEAVSDGGSSSSSSLSSSSLRRAPIPTPSVSLSSTLQIPSSSSTTKASQLNGNATLASSSSTSQAKSSTDSGRATTVAKRKEPENALPAESPSKKAKQELSVPKLGYLTLSHQHKSPLTATFHPKYPNILLTVYVRVDDNSSSIVIMDVTSTDADISPLWHGILKKTVAFAQWSPDGDRFAVTFKGESTVSVFKAGVGANSIRVTGPKQLHVPRERLPSQITSLAFMSDIVTVGLSNGYVLAWEFDDNDQSQLLESSQLSTAVDKLIPQNKESHYIALGITATSAILVLSFELRTRKIIASDVSPSRAGWKDIVTTSFSAKTSGSKTAPSLRNVIVVGKDLTLCDLSPNYTHRANFTKAGTVKCAAYAAGVVAAGAVSCVNFWDLNDPDTLIHTTSMLELPSHLAISSNAAFVAAVTKTNIPILSTTSASRFCNANDTDPDVVNVSLEMDEPRSVKASPSIRASPSRTLSMFKLDTSHNSPITQTIFATGATCMAVITVSKGGDLQGRIWNGELKYGATPFRTQRAEPLETTRELKPRQLAITSTNSYLLVAGRRVVQLYDPAGSDKFMKRKESVDGRVMQLPADPADIKDSLTAISLHPADNNSPVYGLKGGRIFFYIKKLPTRYAELEQSSDHHRKSIRRLILWSVDLSAGTGRLISASRDGVLVFWKLKIKAEQKGSLRDAKLSFADIESSEVQSTASFGKIDKGEPFDVVTSKSRAVAWRHTRLDLFDIQKGTSVASWTPPALKQQKSEIVCVYTSGECFVLLERGHGLVLKNVFQMSNVPLSFIAQAPVSDTTTFLVGSASGELFIVQIPVDK